MSTTHHSIRTLESLIPLYPPHFHTIEAAKSYVASICAISLADPASNKLAFLVAVRAFEAGEFYLDVPLLDRGALRGAITCCVERIMPRITKWPAIFLHVGAVKTFIANMCPETNDMVFDGVENHVFQGYVLFHTARSAWEGRMYDIQHVPKGWKRVSIHKAVQVPKTLTETVELNIATLTPLLAPWPPFFTDLNAARDHVRQCCYAMHFRYVYFPGEQDWKLRTYVHFNTAKYAFGRGEFGLDGKSEMVRRDKFANGVKRVGEVTEEVGERGEVSTAPYSLVRGGKVVGESREAFRGRAEAGVSPLAASDGGETMVDGTGVEVKTEEKTEEKADEEGEVKTEDKLEAKEIDPFKALIADLRRVSILKAAFE